MIRQLAAWQRGDRFYLSAFVGPQTHGGGTTPAREFPSREELEAEVNRRNGRLPGTDIDARRAVEVVWEHLEDG